MSNKQEYNLEILKVLVDYIHKNPEVRFLLALYNLNIIQEEDTVNYLYNLASSATYDRILDSSSYKELRKMTEDKIWKA